jgi:hypothetical protein
MDPWPESSWNFKDFCKLYNEGKEKTIKIVDMKSDSVQVLIKWLYLGILDDPNKFAKNLFTAADKYNIQQLKVGFLHQI